MGCSESRFWVSPPDHRPPRPGAFRVPTSGPELPLPPPSAWLMLPAGRAASQGLQGAAHPAQPKGPEPQLPSTLRGH